MTSTAGGLSEEARVGRVAFPDLVIAGPGWESRYGEEVRMLIDEVNRSIALTEHRTLNTEPRFGETAPRQHFARVHAVGMLSGAAKWGALYGCEAFVLPSHQENFGIAVVEALACGKPVLISDQVNIWREIVEDGAGLVEGDTEEGVEKLLKKFLSAQRAEASGRSAFAPSDSLLHSATAAQDGVTRGGPRECYLKRFAIGPAAVKLAAALKGTGVASDW
jgi:glycosyltransferase involved in cell wall biosynthesis